MGMACHAFGRCRICARKHEIAVFGSEEAQHNFIENANLRLIILNTVCSTCITKIELIVKKMNLNTIFIDCNQKQSNVKKEPGNQRDHRLPQLLIENSNVCREAPHAHTMAASNKYKRSDDACQESEMTTSRSDGKSLPANESTQQGSICSARSKPSTSSIGTSTSDTTSSRDPEAMLNRLQCQSNRCKYLPTKRTLDNSQGSSRQNIGMTASREEISTIQDSPSSSVDESTAPRTTALGTAHQTPPSKKIGRELFCDFCQKKFYHSGDLNKHRRKHTGEKPYNCDQCQRKFAHTSNLVRHQQVHSGVRPFACPRCNRTFTRKDKLSSHVAAKRCLNLYKTNDANSSSSQT